MYYIMGMEIKKEYLEEFEKRLERCGFECFSEDLFDDVCYIEVFHPYLEPSDVLIHKVFGIYTGVWWEKA